MSFFSSLLYDKVMASTEDACLKKWRKELLESVHGSVLEIGAGTGASIEFYSDKVQRLELSEPDKNMLAQLKTKLATSQINNVSVSIASAEALEADDNTFDFVISSLVCCSVTHLDSALDEIKRVLKPGGSLVFLEHIGAPVNTKRRIWQNRLTPIWRKLAGNCHLNRETESAILAAGFEIQEIQRESLRKAMPLVRPSIRGFAKKPC